MTITAIYTVVGVSGEKAINIKYLDTIDSSQIKQLRDTPIEIYDIAKYIEAGLYACNITNHFIASSKKLPILCLNVSYTKYTMRRIPLYKLFLYFTITDDNINSYDELLTKNIKGQFSMELFMENNNLEIDENISNYTTNDEFKKMLIDISKSPDMIDMCNNIISDEELKLSTLYADEFKQFTDIPVPINKK